MKGSFFWGGGYHTYIYIYHRVAYTGIKGSIGLRAQDLLATPITHGCLWAMPSNPRVFRIKRQKKVCSRVVGLVPSLFSWLFGLWRV